ncbi:MAG: dTMP kinase [Planctomycetes bacterium]|nr:dTMP kinase [Planctomycetota bacterium]
MSRWITQLRGKFLVFDGPDGSGKTTQFDRFAEHCRQAGLGVCEVREPGGTAFGEQIRRILLDPASPEMSVRCEMMLYMASRAQLVEQTIAPALQRGELVLADRFISSTLAYQGAAGGLSPEEILAVGRIAVQSSWPDLTVIFDVDETTAARRLVGSAKDHRYIKVFGPTLFSDRLELRGAEYQQRVRKGYLQQAKDAPQRHLVIDSRNDPDSVFETLLNRLQERFA